MSELCCEEVVLCAVVCKAFWLTRVLHFHLISVAQIGNPSKDDECFFLGIISFIRPLDTEGQLDILMSPSHRTRVLCCTLFRLFRLRFS